MPSSRPRLLLVEDDPGSHKTLLRLLTRLGFDVLSAMTVEEGLSRLGDGPGFLVLDLMLPDGDGGTILEKVRTDGLPIRVVVTTGVCDPARMGAIAALRPDLVLSKPFDLDDLLRGLGLAP
ncbi:response regulator [Tautonia plasticadhaerens]|uniref:Photosynthetic apparatus regulatory protein RegA n=1 Tax=Tautonia plasticadhaerens TaxID=2527974 RepID=A0A518H382_9BACT|nr:response regulator [Tautonia plasticadhaerens]QDV35301.1 Photosynthetic apparatus regulatory protein RegA [Tautonia plasticadhaerens]